MLFVGLTKLNKDTIKLKCLTVNWELRFTILLIAFVLEFMFKNNGKDETLDKIALLKQVSNSIVESWKSFKKTLISKQQEYFKLVNKLVVDDWNTWIEEPCSW